MAKGVAFSPLLLPRLIHEVEPGLEGFDTGAAGLRVRFIPIPGETPRVVLAQQLVLPAVLDEYEIAGEGGHADYTTVRAGEFSAPTGGEARANRPMRTSDLEALTLIWDAEWLQSSGQDPKAVRSALWRILDYRKPVLMAARIRQPGWEDKVVRMGVTFRSLRERVRREPDTRYFSISTKEWRSSRVVRRGHGVGRGKVALPARHALKATDTLQSLSKHYYGTYAGWRAIATENKIPGNIGQSYALVKLKRYKVGSIVRIPKKPPIATIGKPR